MTVTVRKATAGRTTHDQHLTLIILRVVMAASLVLTIIGLVIVERIGAAYRDALDVAEDAATVAAAATDPATGLTTDLADLTRSLDDTLEAVRSLAETAATSTAQLGEAARTNLADSVEGTAQIADRVADVIEGIERFIPGDSNSLAEELRTVSDGLDPVPEQLRTLGDQLVVGSGDLQASIETLDALRRRIERIASGIEDTANAIDDLPAVARALEASAREARDRVTVDLWLFRIAVVLAGGAVFLVALALHRMLPASAWRHHDRSHDTSDGTPRDTTFDPPPAPGLPVEHDLPSPPH